MKSVKMTLYLRLVIGFLSIFLSGFSLHYIFETEIPPDTPPKVKLAIEGLFSADVNTRVRSAARLKNFGPRAIPVIPFLIELLSDTVKIPNQSGSCPTSPAGAATDILIKMGNPAVKPLIASMKHDNWMIRAGSAEILGNIKNPLAVQSLIKGMNDKNSIVRKLAAEALGKIDSEALIHALKHKKTQVRASAAWALGEIQDPRAVKYLVPLLKDGHVTVQQKAREALNRITGKVGEK